MGHRSGLAVCVFVSIWFVVPRHLAGQIQPPKKMSLATLGYFAGASPAISRKRIIASIP